jgi:hypothetical protein
MRKQFILDKSLVHLIDHIFWFMAFKTETQAEKVMRIIPIIPIIPIYIMLLILVIFIIYMKYTIHIPCIYHAYTGQDLIYQLYNIYQEYSL